MNIFPEEKWMNGNIEKVKYKIWDKNQNVEKNKKEKNTKKKRRLCQRKDFPA